MVEVVLSPKSQLYFVAPVDVLVKVTLEGAMPAPEKVKLAAAGFGKPFSASGSEVDFEQLVSIMKMAMGSTARLALNLIMGRCFVPCLVNGMHLKCHVETYTFPFSKQPGMMSTLNLWKVLVQLAYIGWIGTDW